MLHIVLAGIVCVIAAAALVLLWARDRRLPLTVAGRSASDDVVPPRNPRAGVAAASVEGCDLARLGAGWYRNWTHRPFPGVDLEFMPLIAGYTGRKGIAEAYLADMKGYIESHVQGYPDGTIWQVGNEIGYKPQRDARTPQQYAEDYHRCREMLKEVNPTYRLALGAVILAEDERVRKGYVGGRGGVHYLQCVHKAYETNYRSRLPADFYTASAYVFGNRGVDAELFREQIISFREFLAGLGRADVGLIIHEYGCPFRGPTAEARVAFMRETFEFLANARDDRIGCAADHGRLVQRWAWFTTQSVPALRKLRRLGLAALSTDLGQTSLFTRSGDLTCLGRAYTEQVAAMSNEEAGHSPPGDSAP